MTGTLASRYELVIFDLDGVVYLGRDAVPGAADAIRSIVDAGTPVAYVTNNASRAAEDVAALLGSMGVPARAEEVLTSAQAAATLLAEDLPPQAPVLVVGADALRDEIRAVGLTPVDAVGGQTPPGAVAGETPPGAVPGQTPPGADGPTPVAVVQGYGPEVGWADLAEACVAVRDGARWVATNTDATLPSPRGPLPGNGSLVAALSTALGGRRPDTVVGKPSPALFEVTARRRGARRVLVVGDRLDTDIEGAVRAGMDCLLVLTGVSTAADLLRAGPQERPTHVAADSRALSMVDSASRVPAWPAGHDHARTAGWRVVHDDGRLILAAASDAEHGGPDGPIAPDPVGALRVLAAAAWAYPRWREIVATDPDAAEALVALGLDQVRAASAA